jgi:hypothetical protein
VENEERLGRRAVQSPTEKRRLVSDEIVVSGGFGMLVD